MYQKCLFRTEVCRVKRVKNVFKRYRVKLTTSYTFYLRLVHTKANAFFRFEVETFLVRIDSCNCTITYKLFQRYHVDMATCNILQKCLSRTDV